MNKASLIIGGHAPSYLAIANDIASTYLCAADSGFDTCLQWNILPDLAVGDMDSLIHTKELTMCREILRFPKNKDYTDTELGINILYERGYDNITIIGGGGGRLDHTIALLYLFFRNNNTPYQWITENERILLVTTSLNCRVPIQSIISIFPGPHGASSMKSSGLKWPLEHVQFKPGYFGISNVAQQETVTIETLEEPLIVILPIDAVILV
mgnify:CR=1 FL=1